MALLIDEVRNFPQTELITKTGEKVWTTAKGLPKPLWWRIKDAIGVLTGEYDAFRYLTQNVMSRYESKADMKRQAINPDQVLFRQGE